MLGVFFGANLLLGTVLVLGSVLILGALLILGSVLILDAVLILGSLFLVILIYPLKKMQTKTRLYYALYFSGIRCIYC